MKGWLENPPGFFCASAVVVAIIGGIAFGVANGVLFGTMVMLWAVPFGIAAACIYRLPGSAKKSPVWRRIVKFQAIIERIAPYVGAVASLPCFALAVVFAGKVQLLFLANLFWGTVFVSAGLLANRIGVRRTLALGLLMGAGMYLMTAVYFLDQGNTLFVYFNLPWSLLFGAVAFAVDRGRNVAKEQAPPEAREDEPPGGDLQ